MPIFCMCPGCDTQLKLPDDLAGRRTKCKYCTAPITVPGVPYDRDDDDSSDRFKGNGHGPSDRSSGNGKAVPKPVKKQAAKPGAPVDSHILYEGLLRIASGLIIAAGGTLVGFGLLYSFYILSAVGEVGEQIRFVVVGVFFVGLMYTLGFTIFCFSFIPLLLDACRNLREIRQNTTKAPSSSSSEIPLLRR